MRIKEQETCLTLQEHDDDDDDDDDDDEVYEIYVLTEFSVSRIKYTKKLAKSASILLKCRV